MTLAAAVGRMGMGHGREGGRMTGMEEGQKQKRGQAGGEGGHREKGKRRKRKPEMIKILNQN